MILKFNVVALLVVLLNLPAMATEQSGHASTYTPTKAVYDVASASAFDIKHILDRVSLLQRLYGDDPFEASIILVIHEGALPLFTKTHQNKHMDIVKRARGLSYGEVIQFRICQASAKMQGLARKDFDDFIKLVPMADAEIIKLQHEGYAYMK